MTPLPTDLAQPPVPTKEQLIEQIMPITRSQLPQPARYHVRLWARRLHGCLLGCKEAWLQRSYHPLGTKDTPPVEPPLLNRGWGYDQFVASPLRATHIASATYRGLRGFERWVR